MRRARAVIRAALPLLALLLPWSAVEAQLLSPGPLSAPHAELQGVRQCTACHQLGQRGVGTPRCLSCHQVLSARLREEAGYHATVRDRTCGSCHAEHYGRDFTLVRLDTATFDHRDTGYALKAAHAEAECGACHTSANVRNDELRKEKKTRAALDRTFLGLSPSCGGCHGREDPHGRQFNGRSCSECHAETKWTEAATFDHGRSSYPLTGAHRTAECSGCHEQRQGVTQYDGVQHSSCATCHADPHRGTQGTQCASCHTTSAWRAFGAGFDVSRFNHDRTRFALAGAHARIDCAACHRTPARNDGAIRIRLQRSDSRFAPIAVADCRSCHLPAHPGARPDHGAGANCSACHDQDAWAPAAFGMREHAATRFPLDGAHVLLDCRKCHGSPGPGRLEFRRADITCNGCHADASPHGNAYADGGGVTVCSRCHVTRSWQPQDVAHETFPLDGAHAQVACASCHTPGRARTPRDCESCHAAADPHAGRSAGRTCSACHATSSFTAAISFDHGTTRYPLEGAHVNVRCRACHLPEPATDDALVLRYSPLSVLCEDCHGS